MRMLLTATLTPCAAMAADADIGASGDAMLPPPTPLTAAQTLYLDVTLNQTPRGLLPFTELQGRLMAAGATLRQLGFPARGEDPVALDQLGGVVVRYDAALQTLALDVPLEQLSLPTTRLERPTETAPAAAASPGVVLNYDVYGSHNEGGGNLALTTALRVFGLGQGVLETSALLRTYQDPADHQWQGESVRLDTAWRLDFPDSAVSLTVGDFYSGFVDWSRPVRMGGVQVGRNYGLQPYRVLTPTPTFLGEAVVPSNVELYVDGLRQYNGEVPIGPFQLAAQPGINGTGNAQVVITDAFGRMQTLDFSFYGTQQLLAKGLSDWSAGVGRMRRDYGIRSFAYETPVIGSATWRYGASDRFTAEAHAEGGGGVLNGGAGGWWLLGGAGVVNAAYAHSRYAGLQGGQYSLGYSWNNRRFNVNVLTRRTHGAYRDLGALQDTLPPDISEQATLGINLQDAGSLSASYLRLRYPDGDDNRYASLFWSRSFGDRWSAYLSFNQNLADSDDRSAYLSVSAALGRNRQSSVSAQRNGERLTYVADLSQPVPGDGSQGGYGWRVQARGGDDGAGGLAELGWLNRVGRYSMGYARQDDVDYGYASASGSVVWMGGHVFAAREVPDAFAVVSTDGFGGIPVRLENRLIGSTDRNGLLLVTPLLSWQRNRLSIDTLDLPADMRADRVDTWVTPRQSAGLGVNFGLRRTQAMHVVLHDPAGAPLPVGSQVRLPGGGSATVGYDGETYLEDVATPVQLEVDLPDGHCRVHLAPPVAATSPGVPSIGPLRCLPVSAP
ncbi:fimbrial biogenesis outer membrane usher protein [Stenotrophomonas sp. SAM-B]|uniref:fimbria/pilus outer membrane usher protein n=1 Tax=Stenotrophomonas sp. SAM-B TaxID=2729141 RepID=UPI00159F7382|nr:fimbria/pilus outer membrane usher protein [Stenotrophomonas sp. SAM-B]NWF33836.1 fimbrial biogenesis outer membrane usher protein [Stenotrophomonas sp. SAM-B]